MARGCVALFVRRSVVLVFGSLAAFAGLVAGRPAAAQTTPSGVQVEVIVTVTEEQTPSGYVYRYRVENKSSYAMGSLKLGYNAITGETDLDSVPISIRSPEAWTGELASDEGAFCVVWDQVDFSDTGHEVAPGSALEGFEVTLPGPASEYRRASFTAYLANAVHDVGNVKPAAGAPVDRTAPTVSVTVPANGASLSGLVPISADAADETGIADVQFLLDGQDMSRYLVEPHLVAAPYGATWRTYGIANGIQTLTAVARDIAGNRTTSAGITVTLQNDETPLTISLARPMGGSIVSGTAPLSATVTSGSRVMGVLFRVDDVMLGGWVANAPYTMGWDTSAVPNGSHTLTATAMNEAGAVEQTSPVTVTVRNGGSLTSITETDPAKLWVGLKNSDDQGTPFDLRVVLSVNGTTVAEGLTRCVSGLTRNPAQAREVSVAFGAISSHDLSTGDVLSLQLSTRVGTNADGSRCQGHSNAIGLRLYYDGSTRPSRFGAKITPDPLRAFFLRSSGAGFVLDTTSPTTNTAKEKDSGPVAFSGGNPWVPIGSWTRSMP
jgi:hypothetical protein